MSSEKQAEFTKNLSLQSLQEKIRTLIQHERYSPHEKSCREYYFIYNTFGGFIMAIVRIEKSSNYTVISNYPLKDMNLSLKSIGLLCKMLSLPDGWEFSIKGLSLICKENKSTVQTCLNELEDNGYVITRSERNTKGQFAKIEYIIYETPIDKEKAAVRKAEKSPDMDIPDAEKPDAENPYTENRDTVKPDTEKQPQLNTNQSNKEKLNTDLLSIDSFHSGAMQKPASERSEGKKVSAKESAEYREIIKENINYDVLCFDHPARAERIDELVEIITETVCSGKKYIKVAGSELDTSIVRSQFLKLRSDHILFVIDCMDKSTSEITCMKSYLITALYNSLTTINHYYDAWVNHDEA